MRSVLLIIALSIALYAQPIPSTTLIGDWIITARIEGLDTAWCDTHCGKITFTPQYRAFVTSAQEQELSFRWLITNQTLNFYDDIQKKRKRKEKLPRIPGKFIITDISQEGSKKVVLTHTTENYTYILIPDSTEDEILQE